jgi:hypothetical protein
MTPLTPQTRDQLLRLLPPELHGKAVVAGSYLAAPQKAEDIDLWLTCGRIDDPQVRSRLHRHLRQLGMTIPDQLLWGEDVPEYEETGEFCVVYTLPPEFTGLAKPVQILETIYSSAEGLVGAFDINVHALAEKLHGPVAESLVFAEHYAELGKNTVLVSVEERPKQAEHSLERLEKFAERYALAVDAASFKRLLQLVDVCESSSMSDAA